MAFVPHIVALGGTARTGSSTERALAVVLAAAEAEGARVTLLPGSALALPVYLHDQPPPAAAERLVEALRSADGVVLGSPGYHGGISGLVKNALDYTQAMSADRRPYLDGRAVASLATAGGWQAAVATLGQLRQIVHALRGWNTPIGVAINTGETTFDDLGQCLDPRTQAQLSAMGAQVVAFARAWAAISDRRDA